MWKCPKCSENLNDEFEVCWSCGTTREGVVNPDFLNGDTGSPAPENLPMEKLAPFVDEDAEPMVTVAQCQLSTEAHAMRIHLEEAGIPVFLADELTVAMDWLLSNAIGGVKVQVPESYAERAAEVLENFSRSKHESETDDEDE
jgi:Putative prokaryotic signal transducing protein